MGTGKQLSQVAVALVVCIIGAVTATLAADDTTRRGCQMPQAVSDKVEVVTNSVIGLESAARLSKRHARAVSTMVINAPPDVVWSVLTNWSKYPQIFQRIQACHVSRREGARVWLESDLKPHALVHKLHNVTINDLSGKPNILDWQLLSGNFRAVRGRWELKPLVPGHRCRVVYSLDVDPGPVVPSFVATAILKVIQKEAVASLKEWVESPPTSAGTG